MSGKNFEGGEGGAFGKTKDEAPLSATEAVILRATDFQSISRT